VTGVDIRLLEVFFNCWGSMRPWHRLIIGFTVAVAAHAGGLAVGVDPHAPIRNRPHPTEVSIRLVAPPPAPSPPPAPAPIRRPSPKPTPRPKIPSHQSPKASTPAPLSAPTAPEPIKAIDVAPDTIDWDIPSNVPAAEAPAQATTGAAVTESAAATSPAFVPVTISVPLYDQNPSPAYPRRARLRGYEGTVVVEAFVTVSGDVSKARLAKSSGYGILDDSALSAVGTWRFEPARRGDTPIAMWVSVPVKFELK